MSDADFTALAARVAALRATYRSLGMGVAPVEVEAERAMAMARWSLAQLELDRAATARVKAEMQA